MRKVLNVLLSLMFVFCLCGCSNNNETAQKIENNVIHELDPDYQNFEVDTNKYELDKVYVFSRHNIRSPLSTGGSTLSEVTNNKWFDWSSNASELSLRGGDLETEVGQYFRKYLVNMGLMEENWIPEGEEVRVYANSMQRTIATANYFVSGMFPVANIDVEYHMDIGTMDPVFFPQATFVSDKYYSQVLKEINENLDIDGLKDNFEILEEVLDYDNSNMAKTTPHFDPNDYVLKLEIGDEPRISGSLNVCNSAADALKLQYYEEEDNYKAAFNHDISIDKWLDICEITDTYGELLFAMPSVSINLAHPLLQEIYKELNNDKRVFTFMCGHDSNIASLLGALDVKEYSLPKTLERKTPIGSTILIEKWHDKATNEEYYSICLQYQSLYQLENMPILDLNNKPVKYLLSFNGLEQNEDGLCRVDDFNKHLLNKINAYDELVEKYK